MNTEAIKSELNKIRTAIQQDPIPKEEVDQACHQIAAALTNGGKRPHAPVRHARRKAA